VDEKTDNPLAATSFYIVKRWERESANWLLYKLLWFVGVGTAYCFTYDNALAWLMVFSLFWMSLTLFKYQKLHRLRIFLQNNSKKNETH